MPQPDRLSGVCHLATGTGKSYVMFAVAYLSILMGKVRRVMILGPSSTVIESGLREKFNDYLYGEKSAELKPYLPERLRHKTIRLLKCNDVIVDDSIVIENINAIYAKDRNSIGDTLFNYDREVLVLSDEVHHAYSHLIFSGDAVGYDFTAGREGRGDDLEERLWMKFIWEEPLIKRHIGFTGTPYNANEYFPDVICNYSIKDAIDEKIIKRISPIIKTETDEGDGELTRTQRFEQIIATHAENKKKYGYYEYWKGGRDRVRRSFNPDFFIRISIRDCLLRLPRDAPAIERLRHLEDQGIEELILVVEIKGDDDQSEETRAKEQYGREHFVALNQRLREANPADFKEQFRASLDQQYIFYLLRPADYPQWFGHLRTGAFVFNLGYDGNSD